MLSQRDRYAPNMNYAQDLSLPNGVHSESTPELVVNGDDKHIINGQHVNGQHLNGQHINGQTNLSPAADSPDTPVSNIIVSDVKIAMDYQEQESDVRNEPIPIKSLDRSETASTIPQPGTPADPCRFYFFVAFPVASHPTISYHPCPSADWHSTSIHRRSP
jgi:hypothetical protein